MVVPGPCRQPHATATGSPAQVPGDAPLPPQPYFGTCALTGFGQRWATARCFVQWCNFWAIWLYLGLHLEASWSCIHPPRTWRPWGGPLVILVAHCSPLYSFGAPSHSSGSQCLQGWCVGRMSSILLQPTACRGQPQAALGFGLWGLTAGGSVAADVGLHAEGRLLLCGGLFLGMVLACSCSQLAVGGTQ